MISSARWFLPVTYAWSLIVLSAIQARFVGELVHLLAVSAGFGLVYLAGRIDVSRRPAQFATGDSLCPRIPDTKQIGYLGLLFLLIAGLSIVQVPVMTSKVATPTELSDTAFYLEEYS